MSQAEREQALRWRVRDLRGAVESRRAAGQPPFAVDLRKLAEAEKDLAKIDARKAAKGARA